MSLFTTHCIIPAFVFSQNREKQLKEVTDTREYEYDAFVCYSINDHEWVTSHLLRLESEFNHRLCFHNRDWMSGHGIVENIIKSIESSRKIVLIVSNAFTKSQWYLFELVLAQTRIFDEDQDNMILISIEELNPSGIPQRLRLQMERQTYIEWSWNNAVGQHLFWVQLSRSLSKPSPRFNIAT